MGLSEYNSFSSPRNLLSEVFSVQALPPDYLLLNSQNTKHFTNRLKSGFHEHSLLCDRQQLIERLLNRN